MPTRILRALNTREHLLPVLLLAVSLAGCAGQGPVDRSAQAATAADPVCDAVKKLQGPAREEVLAFARLLAIRPAMAIDFSGTTGEYCLNTGDHVMAHFAADPRTASEDVIYLVDAAPLVARGLKLEEFQPLDPDPRKRQPNTWYLYSGKGTEPHHGREMSDRTWLVLAVDVK